MKIEFLNDISDGGKFKDVVTDKLLRIYDFTSDDIERFKDIIEKTILKGQSAEMNKQDFIKPVNCNLTLSPSLKDIGLTAKDNLNFTCYLTSIGYKKMIDLLDPFIKNPDNGFQWLYDTDNEIEMLLSQNGNW